MGRFIAPQLFKPSTVFNENPVHCSHVEFLWLNECSLWVVHWITWFNFGRSCCKWETRNSSFGEVSWKSHSERLGNLIGTGKSICHANALCTVQNSCISLYDLGLLMV